MVVILLRRKHTLRRPVAHCGSPAIPPERFCPIRQPDRSETGQECRIIGLPEFEHGLRASALCSPAE